METEKKATVNNNELCWSKILFPFKIRAPKGIKTFHFDIDIKKKDAKIFDLVRQIKQEVDMLLADIEAYTLYSMAKKVVKISGDIAEVGVYRGGSAKLIHEATTADKLIHIFDTFEGLPDVSKHDDSVFQKGGYPASFEDVTSYLRDCHNIQLYKGMFPDTAAAIKNKIFSLVHIDADIYESTLNCLKFFYPRMNRGGIIISHDYTGSKGVQKAFNEFFADKREIIIEPLWTDQCLIVKV